MLSYTLSFKDETSVRDRLIVWLQSSQNHVELVDSWTEPNHMDGKASLVVLDGEEHKLAIADGLHRRLGHCNSRRAPGEKLNIHVRLNPKTLAKIRNLDKCLG